MKLHPRTLPVQGAEAEIRLALIRLQQERDLTDVEMLQAVGVWQASVLKYMLRAERHPEDPDRPADQAPSPEDL